MKFVFGTVLAICTVAVLAQEEATWNPEMTETVQVLLEPFGGAEGFIQGMSTVMNVTRTFIDTCVESIRDGDDLKTALSVASFTVMSELS